MDREAELRKQGVERSDAAYKYYLAGGELTGAPSRFVGKGAAKLGLEGGVTAEAFEAVSSGADPATGEILVSGHGKERVKLQELLISAPKSLSLALAVASPSDRDIILRALRDSADDTIAYMEQLPLVRRKVDGVIVHEKAAGIVGMAFEHLTSRPTPEAQLAGLPMAPQWHIHLEMGNMALRQDGTWGAIDSREIETAQSLLDAYWQTKVMERLEAAGIRVETTREVEAKIREHTVGEQVGHSRNREIFINGFSDRNMIAKWSPRTKQVTDYQKTQFSHLLAAGTVITADIKERVITKSKSVGKLAKESAVGIFDDWRRLMAADGLTAATLEHAKELGVINRTALTPEFVLKQALQRVPEEASVITWSKLRALIAEEALSYGLPSNKMLALVDSTLAIERPLKEVEVNKKQQAWLQEKIEIAEKGVYPNGKPVAPGLLEHYREEASARKEELAALTMRVPELEEAAEAARRRFEALSPELVVVSPGLVTTRSQVAAEAAVVKAVTRLATAGDPIGAEVAPAPDKLQTAITSAFAGTELADAELTEDQQAALKEVLEHRVTMVTGHAGAGKSPVARVAAQVWKDSRPEAKVIALAVSGERVEKFAADTSAEGMTFESFAASVKQGSLEIDENTLLLIDEVAQVDTVRLAAAFEAIGSATPALVAVGDVNQLGSIGAGDLFRELVKASGHESPEIKTVLRNSDAEYTAIWTALRDPEKALEAVTQLHERGQITFTEDHEAAIEQAIDMWQESFATAGSKFDAKIVTSLSNSAIDDISRRCQVRRLTAGELGLETLAVEWHDPQNPSYIREFGLHAGDQVAITQKLWLTEDGKRTVVKNGTLAEITNVDTENHSLTLKLRDGAEHTLQHKNHLHALRLAYASHHFKTQGDSLAADLIHLATPGEDLSTAYVAHSRTKTGHKTLTVAAIRDFVPDLDDRGVEVAPEEYNPQKWALEALATSWHRTPEHSAAIELLPSDEVWAHPLDYEAKHHELDQSRDNTMDQSLQMAA